MLTKTFLGHFIIFKVGLHASIVHEIQQACEIARGYPEILL